jgi:acetyl esterase/lipase
MAPKARLPAGVTDEIVTLGGVSAEWLVPNGAPESPVLVFVHGGGIFFALTAAERLAAALIGKASGFKVLAVDYRIMPGNPYPAAHDDCFAAYSAVAGQGTEVCLIGESSGGVLSLAVMLRARAADVPLPRLWVGLSPTADYAFDTDSEFRRSRDPFVSPAFVAAMHRHYVNGADLSTPDLSPGQADLTGLPDVYIVYGEHELLSDHVIRLARGARQHGIQVELQAWPHMWHGWHLLCGVLPEADQTLMALGANIRRRMLLANRD